MYRIIALAALAAAGPASAAVNLVSNGGFEQSTYNGAGSHEFGAQFGQFLTGWTAPLASGYSVRWNPATASTVSADTRWGGNGEKLSLNFPGASPDGGYFIGSDADFQEGPYNSPIQQQINGLVAGGTYKLRFHYAFTQLSNRSGPTTNALSASLGSQSWNSGVANVPDQGFVGWRTANVAFIANSASELLSFVAAGGPSGLPPFTLIDGVSLQSAVPEPATWAMLIVGFGLVGMASRRRVASVSA